MIGIDLGTSNTVLAYATAAGAIETLAIEQLVGPGQRSALSHLPSVLYAPIEGEERDTASTDAPHTWISGAYALRRGREVPGRSIFSAKSWLTHRSVDRSAPILPWGAQGDVPHLSPVVASAQYLLHVKCAWDAANPKAPLATQPIVLTVPASFDDDARALTLEAARMAGLTVTLLEEPQAAFQNYLHHATIKGLRKVAPTGKALRVLVCDVGGGTTDLSLFHVGAGAKPKVERVATGPHLLVGGDNMDLLLAHHVEVQMLQGKGESALAPFEFVQVLLGARSAKEKLLGSAGQPPVPIAVARAGSSLVGSTLRGELTERDVHELLVDAFFPKVTQDASPERKKRGFSQFGLPYERDVAITRHLAHFLRTFGEGLPVDAVLFNGGVFHAEAFRTRVLEVLQSFQTAPLAALPLVDPDLAVAKGAVASLLARAAGSPRIESRARRSYYVAAAAEDGVTHAVCVLSRGTPEGEVTSDPSLVLGVRRGGVSRFELYIAKDARVDAVGASFPMDDEHYAKLPSLVADIPSDGARSGGETPVTVRAVLRDRLDLSLVSKTGEHFALGFALAEPPRLRTPSQAPPRTGPLTEALGHLASVLGVKDASHRDVVDLGRTLEQKLGPRSAWSLSELRSICDALLEHRGARRKSAEHERAFWQLVGFAARPGFGDPLDEARVRRIFSLFEQKLAFPDKVQGWAAFLVTYRRIAPGLLESEQVAIRDAFDPFVMPALAKKAKGKSPPLAKGELDSLLAFLERVPKERRADYGNVVMERAYTDKSIPVLDAMRAVASRYPTYASDHHAVDGKVAEGWVEHLIRLKFHELPLAASRFVAMARLTGDRVRDLSEGVRRSLERALTKVGATPEETEPLREVVALTAAQRASEFGDDLPLGLVLRDDRTS